MSPEEIRSARRLRAEGMSWENLSRQFGMGTHALRSRMDPDFTANHRLTQQLSRKAAEARRVEPTGPVDTERSIVVSVGGMPVSLPRIRCMETQV